MEEDKKNKVKTIWERLKVRYHLSIVNKSMLLEVYSRDISRGRLLAWVGVLIFTVMVFTYSVIAFTPLKSAIIPGYESEEMRLQQTNVLKGLFKLQKEVNGRIEYGGKIDTTVTDFGFPLDSINQLSIEKIAKEPEQSTLLPDRFIDFSVNQENKSLSYFHFFKPIPGLISNAFNLEEGHYGVDVVTEENTGVKSILNGKVILASWTAETGHVIVVQHSNEFVSIYKHNSILLKKEGEIVKAGEVIAIVGNSGEFTTGPHLHFEIWFNGAPLNPSEVIKFE